MKDTFGHRLVTLITLQASGICLFVSALAATQQSWGYTALFSVFFLLLLPRGISWVVTGRHDKPWSNRDA